MNSHILPDWCNAMRHPKNVADLCEGEHSSIPLPHSPNVYLSKKCSDSEEGLGLTRALVSEARLQYLA